MGQHSVWANNPGPSTSSGIKLLQRKWWVQGGHVPWWDFMCEQGSPDPWAEPLSGVSALYPLVLLAVKPVHLGQVSVAALVSAGKPQK